ncbi:required for meiotic nuclear division protein 1 homolog isoform X1 [Rhopilema esculentum]|uniref:required for meiotic nuclear division protein 1 homolog isoform X1 n=1 Tax=Rhopilema esculentum TaxID=499914 RepID=UPI0031D3B408
MASFANVKVKAFANTVANVFMKNGACMLMRNEISFARNSGTPAIFKCFCSTTSSVVEKRDGTRPRTKSPSSTISKRDRLFRELAIIIRKGKVDRFTKDSWLCTAYSTGESYNIEALRKYFERKSSTYKVAELPKDTSDVLRISRQEQLGAESHEIFFFRRLGAFVCWNVNEAERVELKLMLNDFQTKPYPDELVERENEQLTYLYKERDSNLAGGDIHLNSKLGDENKALEKYAFANAMALSVKLAIWEAALDQFVDSLRNIPEDLQKGLKPNISRKQVLQKLGELLSLRHQINLYSDLLMTPDFYWDRESLEILYNKTCNYLDVGRRTKVTNEKLNLCSEMVEILRSHLDDRHSLRVEWAIVALIAIEVLFEIGHWIEKFFPL